MTLSKSQMMLQKTFVLASAWQNIIRNIHRNGSVRSELSVVPRRTSSAHPTSVSNRPQTASCNNNESQKLFSHPVLRWRINITTKSPRRRCKEKQRRKRLEEGLDVPDPWHSRSRESTQSQFLSYGPSSYQSLNPIPRGSAQGYTYCRMRLKGNRLTSCAFAGSGV
jgi:hypothetical protein